MVVTTVDTLAAESAAIKANDSNMKVEITPDSKQESKHDPEKPAVVDAPKTFTQEELEKQIGRRVGREQAKFQRQLQEEREARIRLEEQLKARAPAEQKNSDNEPQLADYDDFQKYSRDLAKWVAKQEVQSTLSERQALESQYRANAAQQQTAAAWGKKVEAALKDIPDYVDVVSAADIPLSAAMKEAIMESDAGPKLAYHLATHPDEAARIATLTPIGAVRALTLIEAGFKAKPVTSTPEPIVPTGAKQTTGVKSLSDLSQSEFEKRRREFRAKR